MILKRKKRAKEFKGKIVGGQLEHILTIDGAVLPLYYANGQIYHNYAPKNIKERER